MIERKPEQHLLLDEARAKINLIESEISNSKVVLVVIDDQISKARAIMDEVKPRFGSQQPLPIATVRCASASEGLAFIKVYLTSQDLATETQEESQFPPLVVAMDASLPQRRGADEETYMDMGLRVTQNILNFCSEGEGYKEKPFPLPYFIGYSGDLSPNESLRILLVKNNAGDKYLGDFWHAENEVMRALTAISS